jgi:hypothetical protein
VPFAQPDLIIEQLWQTPPGEPAGEVYAILDAARDERIYPRVLECGLEYCSLYRGDQAEELAEVAPYLVHLQPDAPFTTWLIENGWGESWGIFVRAAASLAELRRHFRRFLMVYDPDGKPLYFRYYDPRVLRVYLPTCNAEELSTLFGPLSRYLVESDDATVLLEHAHDQTALTVQKIPLSP